MKKTLFLSIVVIIIVISNGFCLGNEAALQSPIQDKVLNTPIGYDGSVQDW